MFFNGILEGKPDPVFGFLGRCKADQRLHKVNLLIGTYRNEEGAVDVLPAVRVALQRLFEKEWSNDYLPFEGSEEFCERLGRIAFGETLWNDKAACVYKTQALGGTGALRLGAEFLSRMVTKTIYIPQPTWLNHRAVFEHAGLSVGVYPYAKREFDCDAMCHALMEMPPKSAVLLQASCHNPTGLDPTPPQWKQILGCLQKRSLIPFFDCAYQGFGFGLESDMYAPRLWMQWDGEMAVAYSCSKNFSLYNERVGALFITTQTPAIKHRVSSQVKQLIRPMYSTPPATGARIVVEVLKDPRLLEEWKQQLEDRRLRLMHLRKTLVDQLVSSSKTTDFRSLYGQIGFFLATELTSEQVHRLMEKHAVYMLDSGRLNVAALNQKNMQTVVHAILDVT
jgi:aspartate/tyrosine/aromatic aminotransferase